MNKKQLISIALSLAGIALIIYAMHAMGEVSEAKGFIEDVKSFFRNDIYVDLLGGEAEKQASKYDAKILGLLITGILLTLAGAYGTFFYRKRW